MNDRVLELIKNPKNILPEDLVLLKDAVYKYPYIQSIRAMHLFGTHHYDTENYQKFLAETAAYTTDKKILYQLINGKNIQSSALSKEVSKPIEKETEKSVEQDKTANSSFGISPIEVEKPKTI